MITVKHTGSFKHIEAFFDNVFHHALVSDLNKYGEMGVEALSRATPKDTGLTASSWSYEIKRGKESSSIVWTNSNVNDGVPVAVILQYGHATRNGGYVEGIDYINPALNSVFKNIADMAWKEVTRT